MKRPIVCHYRSLPNTFTPIVIAFGASLFAQSSANRIGPISAVPGTIAGRVTDSGGRPLPHADITIGGTTDSGTHADFEQRTDTRGMYSIRVPSGNYNVRAYYIVVQGGNSYRLPLHPADNDNTLSYDVRPGVVKDFVWRLTGMKAYHNLNPNVPESYYGASILLMDSDPAHTGVEAYTHFPAGTVLEILLTPAGPLLDGSAAKPIRIESHLPWESPDQRHLRDLPAGRYSATVRERSPGGAMRPLRLAVADREGGRASPAANAVSIEFQPANLLGPSSEGFDKVTLYVMHER